MTTGVYEALDTFPWGRLSEISTHDEKVGALTFTLQLPRREGAEG